MHTLHSLKIGWYLGVVCVGGGCGLCFPDALHDDFVPKVVPPSRCGFVSALEWQLTALVALLDSS